MSNMGMNVDDARVRNRIAIIDLADLRVQLDEQGMSNRIDWMGQLIKQLTSYRQSLDLKSSFLILLEPSLHLPKWRTQEMKFSDYLKQCDD